MKTALIIELFILIGIPFLIALFATLHQCIKDSKLKWRKKSVFADDIVHNNNRKLKGHWEYGG